MLTCKETSELISAQYDRRLGLGERLSMGLHLMMCRYCSAVARQIALIQKLVGWQHDADLSASGDACLSTEARDRIATSLAQDSATKDADSP